MGNFLESLNEINKEDILDKDLKELVLEDI